LLRATTAEEDRRVKVASTVLAAVTLVVHDAQQQQPVFRAGVSTVSVYATVRAESGNLVTDLTRDDFEVRDNGVVRDITVFSREIVPITVTLLLDMSTSQELGVEWLRTAGNTLVAELLPDDRARIGTFGAEISISPRLTGDKSYLGRVLAEEIWPGGKTPLWDAIDQAMSSLAAEPGRRVVLVLTDGFDTVSGVGQYNAVSRRAIRENFMIYAVGYAILPGHGSFNAANLSGLSDQMATMARDSGGGFRAFRKREDATMAMTQVVDELHRQYMIGFSPAIIDSKLHKLEVKVRRRGMTVQARRSYLADGK
jgi:Ca-activated chloride channel homolog